MLFFTIAVEKDKKNIDKIAARRRRGIQIQWAGCSRRSSGFWFTIYLSHCVDYYKLSSTHFPSCGTTSSAFVKDLGNNLLLLALFLQTLPSPVFFLLSFHLLLPDSILPHLLLPPTWHLPLLSTPSTQRSDLSLSFSFSSSPLFEMCFFRFQYFF